MNSILGVVVNDLNPLIALKKAQSLGIYSCHLYVPTPEWHSNELLAKIKAEIIKLQITVTAVICGLPNEDYSSIETVRKTVGLVNPRTRKGRINWITACSNFAKGIGVNILQGHLGLFLPDRNTSEYKTLMKDIRRIVDYLKLNDKQFFALETGQESGEELLQVIQDVDRDNVKVNFDPANFLAYDSDEPIRALEVLKNYIVGVHCKDACRPRGKGMLGEERPLGKGKVDIPLLIAKLKEFGYTGPLTIEREIRSEEQWIKDVLQAKRLLEGLI